MSKTLKLKWSKKDNDFKIDYPNMNDGRFIHSAFTQRLIYNYNKAIEGNNTPFDVENLIQELEARGYDKTTLKFEIKLKEE